MKKIIFIFSTVLLVFLLVAFTKMSLRDQYSLPPAQWPAPLVESGVEWKELGLIPEVSFGNIAADTLQSRILLGKTLFFDPRLSSSGKISCSSCHQPSLNWTDGKARSTGHEGRTGKRNAPTIQNSYFYKKLFWDGRARDLADQAFAPIVSESEMNSEMPEVMMKLRRIKGYRELFRNAWGTEQINPERMTEAIATFEMTVQSAESDFDRFLKGNKRALSSSALRGLHLFRTKARCFNCHNGPLLTDNKFHDAGVILYPYDKNDLGLYKVTHQDADKGKFRTPSLRDVLYTGPWFHDGTEKDMTVIIELYHKSTPLPSGYRVHLELSGKEKKDLYAFLKAISAKATAVTMPVMPE